ncbi:MAG: peptidylprolyl isomerase [Alphaproteobacteria bacterium]
MNDRTVLLMTFRRLLTLSIAVCLAAMLATVPRGPARAQDVVNIAAVVNDDVISMFDLLGRTRLVLLTTGLQDSAETRRRLVPQILRTLIDERLQVQEAKRLTISVTPEEIKDAYAELEKQNNIPPGGLADVLRRGGVDISTLEAQVRATLSWNKILRRQVRNVVQVGNDEIDEFLARLEAARGRPQSLVSEIFLAVDSIDQEDAVRNSAVRLAEQLKAGAPFEAMARQFSQSATAAAGGDLGWVLPGEMPEELDNAVQRLQPGEMSPPIRSVAGFHLLQLRDRRIMQAAKSGETLVGLRHIFLRVPQGASKKETENAVSLANTLRENAQDCADMVKLKGEVSGAPFPLPERAKLGELSEELRAVLTKLEIGKASDPLMVNGGVLVVMVCERTVQSDLPPRNQIEEALLNQRLDIQARRYMRDLRRAAFVDMRV